MGSTLLLPLSQGKGCAPIPEALAKDIDFCRRKAATCTQLYFGVSSPSETEMGINAIVF